MLSTLLAVLAILGKVKAAAWAAAVVLLSAAVNMQDPGPIISALPAVVFGFVAIYRPPSSPSSASPSLSSGGAAGVGSPLEALKAMVGRFTAGR